MKRWTAVLALWLFLSSQALAGWEIKFKFAGEEADAPASEVKAKPAATRTNRDEATLPDLKTATLLVEGPKLKFISGETPDHFVVIDLEKQSYIVAFTEPTRMDSNGATRKPSSKPQKIALVGTLDELLSVIDQFMEMLKMFVPAPSTPQKISSRETEDSTKTDVIVKPTPVQKEIAGCKTQGWSVTVLETRISQPNNEKKTELKGTTSFSGELYLCPEIDISYLKAYVEKITKKITEWAKKWAGTFGETMGLEAGGPNSLPLMSAPFQAKKYEEFVTAWKSLKGFPFLSIATTPDEEKDGEQRTRVQFEVISYESRPIPVTEFSVPQGYKVKRLQEMFGEMMGGMMSGGMHQMAQ